MFRTEKWSHAIGLLPTLTRAVSRRRVPLCVSQAVAGGPRTSVVYVGPKGGLLAKKLAERDVGAGRMVLVAGSEQVRR